MKAMKVLVLLVTTIIGYFLGLRWIGPAFVGHPATATAAPVQVHNSDASTAQPTAPIAVPAGSQTAAANEPVAVVSESRHHRTDAMAGADGAMPVIPRRRRHHARPAPSPDQSAGDNSAATGDHSVLPVDAANVSGADNQPAGTDTSTKDNAADNGRGDNGGTPNTGDNSTAPQAGDNSTPAAGDNSAPDSRPAAGAHHRRRPSDAPPPADPGSGAGDNTARTPGADTRPSGATLSPSIGSTARRWAAIEVAPELRLKAS